MGWWELCIDIPARKAERLSTLLFQRGASGVQEDFRLGETPPPRQPWDDGPAAVLPERRLLKAWFEDADQAAISQIVRRACGPDLGAVRWSPVPDTDWEESWKVNFPVIEISERLAICPPWDLRPGAIVLDPGQGFGTGQHPTTRQALLGLDRIADGEKTCLDLGCGSGILAIAAAKLGLTASGVDVEESAVADAAKNAETNGVVCEFSTRAIGDCEPADIVMANLHAELLTLFADDLYRLTRHWLVTAGIMAEKEAAVIAALTRPGWVIAERLSDGEWVSLRYQRASA